jgi:hypothetical protein
MDRAFQQGTDQQVRVNAPLVDQSDQFDHQPDLIRCCCGSPLGLLDQIVDRGE